MTQPKLENLQLLDDPLAQIKFLKEKYGYTSIVKPSNEAENYYFIFKLEDKEPVRIAYGKFDEASYTVPTLENGSHVNKRVRKVSFFEEDPPEITAVRSWWRRLLFPSR